MDAVPELVPLEGSLVPSGELRIQYRGPELTHELVHVVVDIFCGGNFENDYVAIENQVEQYVAQVWGDNIAML